MARTGLSYRVAALEARAPDLKPWHQVIQEVGQSQEEAIAAYEAEHGPVGDDNILLAVVIEPKEGQSTCA